MALRYPDSSGLGKARRCLNLRDAVKVGRSSEHAADGVRCVEDGLLALLEVLVVGQRQPLDEHREGGRRCRGGGRILPRMSSVRSGFFFWGIALEPVENASGRSRKPNSAVAWRVSSSAKRLMCRPSVLQAWVKSSMKSRSEVASMELGVGASEG